MNFHILHLLLLMCTRQEIELAAAVKTFLNLRDLSEHCRRRVVPSVFLGRRVKDANSHTLQFSQLELPYSCPISVKTEPGSNIIMVIQLLSDKSLKSSCTENHSQMLVYELGETFGGYWGALPDTVTRKIERNYTKYYTLSTAMTHENIVEITDTFENSTEEPEELLVQPKTTKVSAIDTQENIQFEIPLVNVSGNFAIDGLPAQNKFDMENMFDVIYDVTPRKGVIYDTSIIPLVQFSMRTPKVKQPLKLNAEPRYQLSSNYDGITQDSSFRPRLLYSTIYKRKLSHRRNNYTNRRLTFKKKYTSSSPTAALNANKRFSKQLQHKFAYPNLADVPILTNDFISNVGVSTFNTQYSTNPWQVIDGFMRSLNVSGTTMTDKTNNAMSELLQNISNMRHNASVYLSPNLSVYVKDVSDNFIQKENYLYSNVSDDFLSIISTVDKVFTKSSKTSIPPPQTNGETNRYTRKLDVLKYVGSSTVAMTLNNTTMTTKLYKNMNNTNIDHVHGHRNMEDQLRTGLIVANNTKDIDSALEKNKTISSVSLTTTHELMGSLVGHESWENVVQAAPNMAALLSNTVSINISSIESEIVAEKRKRALRRKRHIQALSIRESQPRSINQRKDRSQQHLYSFADIQDVAQVLEVEDDEIESRVALRYLRRYVGSALFNICDHRDSIAHHVYLFNTSRIVIAISNFTLERMTVVVTPARSLTSSGTGCPAAHVECQVAGSRVCVHNSNACDGVPNCGVYDVYDEDRLMCGAVIGLQHSMLLAAFTFLVMLLTLLYTLHYWIKRCVPRVADAFFVYTDKSENTLYLESIMRSPMDDDDNAKLFYESHLYEDTSGKEEIHKKNTCAQFFNKCLLCMSCKRQKNQPSVGMHDVTLSSSSTYLELYKMAAVKKVDVSVATGSSLEISNKYNIASEVGQAKYHTKPRQTPEVKVSDLQSYEELNLMKLMKDNYKPPYSSNVEQTKTKLKEAKEDTAVGNEKELFTTEYSNNNLDDQSIIPIIVTCDIHSEKSRPRSQIEKHLRFDEVTITIPRSGDEDDEVTSVEIGQSGVEKRHIDLDIIEEDNVSTSLSRDFKRFWTNTKMRKNKKKKH